MGNRAAGKFPSRRIFSERGCHANGLHFPGQHDQPELASLVTLIQHKFSQLTESAFYSLHELFSPRILFSFNIASCWIGTSYGQFGTRRNGT